MFFTSSTAWKKISRSILITALGVSVSIALNSALLLRMASLKPHIESPVAKKKKYEIFGFAPYWTINNLNNVDFNTLTTLSYFGIPVNPDGTLDEGDVGYATFESPAARNVFARAHSSGAKVVVTLTQMDNDSINSLLSDKSSRQRTVDNAVKLVSDNNLNGVNIDFEYVGDPGQEIRDDFTSFVSDMTRKLHEKLPDSSVTVSVYAASMKDPKIYDIAKISKASDGIFMMAYDFATSSANEAMPTAPLYGYREGKYWYDVSSAVDDFLKVMPSDKLILGLPWYGYNYPVADTPQVKAPRYAGYYYYYWWRGRRYSAYYSIPSSAQMYGNAVHNNNELTGWDDAGKVGWKAYHDESGIWHMIFLEDPRSLRIKYDFAKNKNLGGVGIWALGFDSGTTEMWNLLSEEFGGQLADSRQVSPDN